MVTVYVVAKPLVDSVGLSLEVFVVATPIVKRACLVCFRYHPPNSFSVPCFYNALNLHPVRLHMAWTCSVLISMLHVLPLQVPMAQSLSIICFLICLPWHNSLAVAVLLECLLLRASSSLVPLAMSPLSMLLLQCDLGEWLPTAAFLHLLPACRLDSSVLTTLRLVRSLSFSFNSLMDATAPALLTGVFCLGLQGRVPGIVMVERSVPVAFLDDVYYRLGYARADERDLDRVIQQVAPAGNALAAWCCINDQSSTWLSLQLLLETTAQPSAISFHWLQRPTRAAFLVLLRLANLRAALVFEQHHIVVSDSD